MATFIVIAGASRGIGRAAADALVEQGWPVIGVARSSPDLFQVKAEIEGQASNG